jgi:hypothetical protein
MDLAFRSTGAYNPRKVRGSSTKGANHAYAAAINLNAGENAMGVSKVTMPQFVMDAFIVRDGCGGWYHARASRRNQIGSHAPWFRRCRLCKPDL